MANKTLYKFQWFGYDPSIQEVKECKFYKNGVNGWSDNLIGVLQEALDTQKDKVNSTEDKVEKRRERIKLDRLMNLIATELSK